MSHRKTAVFLSLLAIWLFSMVALFTWIPEPAEDAFDRVMVMIAANGLWALPIAGLLLLAPTTPPSGH